MQNKGKSLDVDKASTDSLAAEYSSKRIRLYNEEFNEDEYEEAVQALQDEYRNEKSSKGSNHKVIKELMEKTKKNHHKWIHEDRPMIREVLDKFPVLRTCRWVG